MRMFSLLLIPMIVACGDADDDSSSADASSPTAGTDDDSDGSSDATVTASGSADATAEGPTSAGTADSSDDGSSGGGGTAVDLGAAGRFTILAKTGISNVPPTSIEGDIGLSPAAATYLTGFSLVADATGAFSTSTQVTGNIYASDYTEPTPTEMTAAVLDMELAFTDAGGRAADFTEIGAGDIGGMTLDPGVYKWGTGLLMAADVTLDGSATDVWIFQVAQDVTVGSGTRIELSGGALAQNVYWQVGGLFDLGTTAHCAGTVMTQSSVRLGTGASVDGRLFAQTAVVLDGNTIVGP